MQYSNNLKNNNLRTWDLLQILIGTTHDHDDLPHYQLTEQR